MISVWINHLKNVLCYILKKRTTQSLSNLHIYNKDRKESDKDINIGFDLLSIQLWKMTVREWLCKVFVIFNICKSYRAIIWKKFHWSFFSCGSGKQLMDVQKIHSFRIVEAQNNHCKKMIISILQSFSTFDAFTLRQFLYVN